MFCNFSAKIRIYIIMEIFEEDLLFARPPSAFEPPSLPALDLNEHLIKRGASTFFMRASTGALSGFGILKGDILIVDRALDASDGAIVVAYTNKGFIARKYAGRGGEIELVSGSPEFKNLKVKDASKLRIFGVVVSVARKIVSI